VARLGPVKRSDFIKRLRKEWGFEGPLQPPERTGAKHPEFMRKDGLTLSLPNAHKKKDIGVELLKRLLSQANISRKEWLGEEEDGGDHDDDQADLIDRNIVDLNEEQHRVERDAHDESAPGSRRRR